MLATFRIITDECEFIADLSAAFRSVQNLVPLHLAPTISPVPSESSSVGDLISAMAYLTKCSVQDLVQVQIFIEK